ncbi:SDR family NAD(P)-dependent oxidoreductase [soil metagenome]
MITPPNNLTGKRALVTGGGQGIGRAIVEELLRQGCHVAIHYRSSAEGARAIQSAAPKATRVECFQGDLTSEVGAAKVVDGAVEFLGGLDILVNNAGDIVGRRKVEEVDLAFWQSVIDVNMTTCLLATRQAVPHLKLSGSQTGSSIVNLSSLAGRKGGHPGSLVYSAAKGALLTWTRALALELGPSGIRVNAVAPGLILETRFHQTHTTQASAEETIKSIPLGRAGTPSDVARAVAFLASESQGFITGATLDINGGAWSG